jgi:hypothetical protein
MRVYSVPMRRIPAAMFYAACLALLAAQWSGMHAHIDDHGFHGTVQGMHGHHHHGPHADDGDDDHGGDVDVRIVDYGLSVSKLMVFVVALGLTLFLLPPSSGNVLPPFVTPLVLRRRARWRPPLRGPPLAPIAR